MRPNEVAHGGQIRTVAGAAQRVVGPLMDDFSAGVNEPCMRLVVGVDQGIPFGIQVGIVRDGADRIGLGTGPSKGQQTQEECDESGGFHFTRNLRVMGVAEGASANSGCKSATYNPVGQKRTSTVAVSTALPLHTV